MLSHSLLSSASRFNSYVRAYAVCACVRLIQSRSSLICCGVRAFHIYSISVVA